MSERIAHWPATGRGRSRPRLSMLLLVAALSIGIMLRVLPRKNGVLDLHAWQLWSTTPPVTLYFPDRGFLFPVSRRISSGDDRPRAALTALIAGPGAGTSLGHPIPPDVMVRSLRLDAGVARVDLSGAFPLDSKAGDDAQAAIVETLTAVPGVTSVSLSVDGRPITRLAKRTPLLYFASDEGLVAVPLPASTTNARDALTSYLAGPPDARLIALPPDARLLDYGLDGESKVLSLNFAYSPSVRALALSRPDRMRLLLLGLIATLTEFPDVRAVHLDFEGHSQLGLGECSDLLGVPQSRPALLNDERLLDRVGVSR